MDSKIKAQALNAAFPGNTLGIFDEPDALIPDAFVPGPARAWVQAAVTQHAANLPRPPVPASVAPQLLEFAHFANLGAQVEREALDAIELTVDNVLGHVSEALRFDAGSQRRVEILRRAAELIAPNAAAFLGAPAWRALGSQSPEEDGQAAQAPEVRAPDSPASEVQGQGRQAPEVYGLGSPAPEVNAVCGALAAALLAATRRGDFSAADDSENAAALAKILLPHLTLEQRQPLAPWLLRAGGAASEAVLHDVRDSFAQLQASCGEAKPPLLAAAARKVQTWYFRAAAKAWAPGLPSSERLRLQAQTAPLADPAGAWPEPLESALPVDPAEAPVTQRFVRKLGLKPSAPPAMPPLMEDWVREAYEAELMGRPWDRADTQGWEAAFMELSLAQREAALAQPDRFGLMNTRVSYLGESRQSLLDLLAGPDAYSRLLSFAPEVIVHLTRAALALPPNNFRASPMLARGAIDIDDVELLRDVNASTPLTADDWWKVLHGCHQVRPRMLCVIAEHVAAAPPNAVAASSISRSPPPSLKAGAELRAYLEKFRPQSFAMMEPVQSERLNALADVAPGLTKLSLFPEGGQARELARFTQLRELSLGSLYLPEFASVGPLPSLEKLVVKTCFRRREGWGALAGFPQLTTLKIVGYLSTEELKELLYAGLAPVLDLHATLLDGAGHALALAAMRDCVRLDRWPSAPQC